MVSDTNAANVSLVMVGPVRSYSGLIEGNKERQIGNQSEPFNQTSYTTSPFYFLGLTTMNRTGNVPPMNTNTGTTETVTITDATRRAHLIIIAQNNDPEFPGLVLECAHCGVVVGYSDQSEFLEVFITARDLHWTAAQAGLPIPAPMNVENLHY